MPALYVSGRHGKTATLVLLGLLIVAAVGGIVWFLLQPPAKPAVDEGRAAVAAFFDPIRAGTPAAAWDATTADFKSFMGKESFVKEVKAHPFLTGPMEFVSIQPVALGDRSLDEYLYRSQETHAANTDVRLLLARENGAWKVDRLTLPK